jgi:hypothetical protein
LLSLLRAPDKLIVTKSELVLRSLITYKASRFNPAKAQNASRREREARKRQKAA